MADMTTSTNAANLHSYYEKKLLNTLEPRLVLQPLGKQQGLPLGLGTEVKWLRYSSVAGSTTPISEGVAPAETSVSTANVTSNILQYGQFSRVSDLLSFTAIDPVMSNLAKRFGFAAAKTIEELIVAEIDGSSAAVQFAGTAVNEAALAAGDNVDHKELIEATIIQKEAEVGPHESGDYVAVLHPFAEFDLKSDSQGGSWLDINKFGGPERKIMNGEFGRMYGLRLLVSDRMALVEDEGVGTADVITNYVIGDEAYGTIKLGGQAIEMIVKKHGSSGVSDPLNQIATVGYKLKGYSVKFLGSDEPKRLIRLKSTSAIAD